MAIALNILLLLVGFVLLIKGADFFVDGSSSVARLIGIPGFVIGLTIVAMGTSAPEAAVSIAASTQGSNEIAISNIVGSNIFNLLVVAGICAVIKPYKIERVMLNRDFPLNTVLCAVLLVMMIIGRSLGLIDGIYDIEDAEVPESASNDDIYQFFTNRLANSGQTKKQETNMAFIDDLRARPSFKNATTEEQLMHEIVNLENSAAKVSALESKVAELSAKLAETRKAGFTALLNQAVSEGKITQAQVPTFLSLLESDETNTKELLASMSPKGNVQTFIHTGSAGADLLSMSWDEIDKAGRLAELKNQYPDAYKQKFEETFRK